MGNIIAKSYKLMVATKTDGFLQSVDIAVELIKDGNHGIPVLNYIDENVSTKVVRIIQSYVGAVNKMVWRKDSL